VRVKQQLGDGLTATTTCGCWMLHRLEAFENLERTLQDKEVDTIIENLLNAYQSELGAYLRK
jgi:hypothetical protein